MVGDFLNLVDALDRELRLLANRREVLGRYLPCLASQNLNLQPDLELILVRPNLPHVFTGISSNHSPARLTEARRLVNELGFDRFVVYDQDCPTTEEDSDRRISVPCDEYVSSKRN